MKPDSATEAIMRLINDFPCLRASLRAAPTGYFDAGFDPAKFNALFLDCGELQRSCCLFVLTVWNRTTAKSMGWNFDLMRFIAVAGLGERQALAKWITEPTWIERL